MARRAGRYFKGLNCTRNPRKGCVREHSKTIVHQLIGFLISYDFLDRYIIDQARRLRYDSVLLLHQPQGDLLPYGGPTFGHMWTTEILDLRLAGRSTWRTERNASAWRAILRGADSGPCAPACGFACCVACDGSPLMRHACRAAIAHRSASEKNDSRAVCTVAQNTCPSVANP